MYYWIDFNEGLVGGTAYCFAINNGKVFAGTNTGIFVSNDSGKTWIRTGNGLPRNYVLSLAFSNNLGLALVDDIGLFLSTDEGENWQNRTKNLSSIRENELDNLVYTFLIINKDLYIGTSLGVYVSTNNGKSWKELNNGLGRIFIRNIISTNSKKLYVATNEGVFHSSDAGRNWSQMNKGLIDIKIMDIDANDNAVFVATKNNGIFKSTNSGNSWFEINNGLNINELKEKNINDLFVNGGAVFLSVLRNQALPFHINISQLPTGLYFVRLRNQTGSFVKLL